MLNQVTLIGRLGAAPEIKQFDSGKRVASMNVATSEWFKDGDEFKEVVEWHKVVVWGNAVERTEKLDKGDMVLVEGKLKTRAWEKDSVKHYSTEVVGIVKRISTKKSSTYTATESQAPAESNSPETDDLPF